MKLWNFLLLTINALKPQIDKRERVDKTSPSLNRYNTILDPTIRVTSANQNDQALDQAVNTWIEFYNTPHPWVNKITGALNSTRGYIAPWIFTGDTMNRLYPSVNPLDLKNNIAHQIASTAFYEATKFMVDQTVDSIYGENPKISNPADSTSLCGSMEEKFIIGPLIKGPLLTITGQKPIVTHAYGLFMNKNKISDKISQLADWYYGANKQNNQQGSDGQWKDTVAILRILVDLGLHYGTNTLAKSYNKIDEVIDNIYKTAKNKTEFIESAYKKLSDAYPNINENSRDILAQLYDKRQALEAQPTTWTTWVHKTALNATIGERYTGFRDDDKFREAIEDISDVALRNAMILIMKKFEGAQGKSDSKGIESKNDLKQDEISNVEKLKKRDNNSPNNSVSPRGSN